MKYRVSELTGEQLNHAVALALGYGFHTFKDNSEPEYTTGHYGDCYLQSAWNPEHNWAQCGELIDKFNITIEFEEDGVWFASFYNDFGIEGETAKQAICRCVVDSVFGDVVEL